MTDCWAKAEFRTPARAAASLNAATVRYIRERAGGKSPAVPDVLWHGADCWLLHNPHCLEFNKLVRDHVIAQPAQ
jgi:hypothetical protein